MAKKHEISQTILTVKLMDDDRASTIEISYPEGLDTRMLEVYFQGPKSGGGDKAVEWLKDIEPGKCHIKFESDKGIIMMTIIHCS